MGREVWGTYSVKDHLAAGAWIADVFLYDRLAIPVPVGVGEPHSGYQWDRWVRAGWSPESQQKALKILGDRAYPIVWGPHLQGEWETRWTQDTAKQLSLEGSPPADPYLMTAGVLGGHLPKGVTAVTAVATYRTSEELATELNMHAVPQGAALPLGTAAIVMGREFLVPDPADGANDLVMLERAAKAASDEEFRRRRSAYWRWQREFLLDGAYLDRDLMEQSIQDMQDVIADEQRALRQQRTKFVTMFALCVASVGVSLAAAPIAPFALAGAFLSVGQYAIPEVLDRIAKPEPTPAALFIASRKALGWEAID